MTPESVMNWSVAIMMGAMAAAVVAGIVVAFVKFVKEYW